MMKLILNKAVRYQTFEGFGASGAWWAQIVGGWDDPDPESGKEMRDRISELLFSKKSGIGLRTYRYNLGAGSAESGRGSYSDPARRAQCFLNNGKPDYSKDAEAVYMMKKAVADGADEVILFVNSPPEAMTKNGLAHLGKHQILRTNLAAKNYKPFADYCLDAAEHFVNEGVPVKYISPVNEPMWIWNGGQEGCHYSPRQAAKVLECVAEGLKNRPALCGVKLSGVENGDIRWFNKAYTREMLRRPAVREAVDAVDVHSYCLHFPLPGFFNDRPGYLKRYRRYMDKKFSGVPVKMSEWCHMKGGRDCGMASALETAKVITEDLTLLNVTSWQHWIACSLYDYCDGLIYVFPETGTFSVTKRLYVTGNFSKYIPFGAVRFEAATDDEEVDAVGFVKDDKTVIVLINRSKTAKSFAPGCAAVMSVTDKDRDLEEYNIAADETITLSPESVCTLIITEE